MTARDLVLAWPEPAALWVEAAPVGNGRLGAMVFGGVERARFQLNDSTVWSGFPGGPARALAEVRANGAGPARFAEVRDALCAKDYRRAESLLMSFEGPYSQEYLPFADLWMSVDARSSSEYLGRTLNLDTGVVEERFTVDGQDVRRATWASAPAGVLCISMSTEEPVDLEISVSSPLRVLRRDGLSLELEVPVDGAPLHEPQVAEPLRYAGGSMDGYRPFAILAAALDTDGEVSENDSGVVVRGLRRLMVTVASTTSAWSPDTVPAARRAAAALARGAENLAREHEADLRALLGATVLRVGQRRAGTFDVAREVLSGKDERLTATVLFQFGRYLLASASRPDAGPPANLQGMWNGELRPAWSSNYTININTQMNYWCAEPAGLSECHLPLFDLLDRLAVTGRAVARDLYGARGWVTHHNTDIWGWSLPVGMGHGNPSWAIWMMGGVWLVQHVWDHYDFTRDAAFLRERGWPLLRGAAEFCLDWLVEGEDGYLDTLPGTSPENLFTSAEGRPESLTVSPAMDLALIHALFTRCLAALDVLGLDDPVRAEIERALPRLRPPGISAGGWLREWAEDLPEHDPAHRHLSPLVGVYPLGTLDAERTPDLAAAATRLLDRRGPGAMGWSWAWKMALRARLGDGESARALFREATRPFTGDPARNAPVDGSEWGGLLPNLFSTHPPFQIDGNYGFTAALAEMLVDSHGDVIRLLPALPAAWPDGHLAGLRCRGGLEVDLDWRSGEITALTVRRRGGDPARPVRVRYPGREAELTVSLGEEVRVC